MGRFARFYFPQRGPVSRVFQQFVAPGEIPYFMATAKAANFRGLDCVSPSVVGGGGESWSEAVAAAMGEALERYSATAFKVPQDVLDSFRELRKEFDVINPSVLTSLGARTFDRGDHTVRDLTEDDRVLWCKGRDLLSGRETYVPSALVDYGDGKFSNPDEVVCRQWTSTGLAFGFDARSTVCKSLCEVIERDAISCFWWGKIALDRIDLEARLPKKISDVLDKYFREAKGRLEIYDLTTDIGVPIFFGVLKRAKGDEAAPNIVVGASCNANKDLAVLKVLQELAQGYNYGIRKRRSGSKYHYVGDWDEEIRSFQDHADLYYFAESEANLDFLRSAARTKKYEEVAAFVPVTGEDTLDFVLHRLEERRLKPVVVDVSSSDVADAGGLVIRAIIPELVYLDGSHRYRPTGHRRVLGARVVFGIDGQQLGDSDLNQFPHPFP